jgi:hypothetical protein
MVLMVKGLRTVEELQLLEGLQMVKEYSSFTTFSPCYVGKQKPAEVRWLSG